LVAEQVVEVPALHVWSAPFAPQPVQARPVVRVVGPQVSGQAPLVVEQPVPASHAATQQPPAVQTVSNGAQVHSSQTASSTLQYRVQVAG
jgi:hypothetical protein